MKKIVLIVVSVILLIGLIGTFAIVITDRDIRKAVISEVDLQKVPDGVYTGSYRSGRWKNNVEVTVIDHRIVSIKNTEKMPDERSGEIVEKAIEEMLIKQRVNIDVISGATLNTKSIQKAVENALAEGIAK
jgi:uncharacterized protein with FMN-binding domain